MSKKKLTIPFKDFMELSPEKQAEVLERETRKLLKKLPALRKNLSTYDDVSDELYNLTEEEMQLYGSTWSNAVRSGSVTTSSAKQGYNRFVQSVLNFNRKSIKELANEYAQKRMDDFMNNIRKNGSLAEIQYAEELYSQMTEEDIRSFTRSKYFLDTDNWGSEQFAKFTEDITGEYSIMTMKLELFMISKGKSTNNIYNKSYYGTDEVISRPSKRKKSKNQ